LNVPNLFSGGISREMAEEILADVPEMMDTGNRKDGIPGILPKQRKPSPEQNQFSFTTQNKNKPLSLKKITTSSENHAFFSELEFRLNVTEVNSVGYFAREGLPKPKEMKHAEIRHFLNSKISAFVNIQELKLVGISFLGDEVSDLFLSLSPTLKSMYLDRIKGIPTNATDGISRLVQLEEVTLREISMENLNSLNYLTNLRSLSVHFLTSLSDPGIQDLHSDSVTNLSIVNCPKIQNWEFLQNFPNLFSLDLGISSFSDRSVNLILHMSSLVYLDIRNTKISAQGLSRLVAMKNLCEIYARQCRNILTEDIQSTAETLFRELKGLRYVDLTLFG
jgi:hypothetical protein